MPDFETRPVRARMIDGATQILARRGLRGTAFSEVIALAGASRGSIYHHFPGGRGAVLSETSKSQGKPGAVTSDGPSKNERQENA